VPIPSLAASGRDGLPNPEEDHACRPDVANDRGRGRPLFVAVLAPVVAQEKEKPKPLTVEQSWRRRTAKGGLRPEDRGREPQNKLADVKDVADEWVRLAALMGKEKPPNGGRGVVEEHSATYEQQVKNVAAVGEGGARPRVRHAGDAGVSTQQQLHNAHSRTE